MAELSADKQNLIAEFMSVTDVDSDRAKFYLELSAWDIQVALASFYEDDGEFDVQEVATVSKDAGHPITSKEQRVVDQPPPLSQPQPSSKPPNNTKFATIHGVKEDDEDSGEEGQRFYAGGSERSGQEILGPKKKSKDDFVGDMFKAAKDLGAEVVDPESNEMSTNRSVFFQGTGYRLGNEESEVMPGTSNKPSSAVKNKKDIVLKMWKTGFSIDNAIEQRNYDDPANHQFLESIRRGEIPIELVREARGGEVSLTMEDHRNEVFETPKLNIQAFSGKGHMLGSPVPPSWSPNSASLSSTDNQKNAESAANFVKVDDNKPTTNIQIRLSDGSRLVARLNHSHTIRHLRQYITLARPQYGAVEFTLMTTFPNRELTDDSKTLQDENLLNAVVMQKLSV